MTRTAPTCRTAAITDPTDCRSDRWDTARATAGGSAVALTGTSMPANPDHAWTPLLMTPSIAICQIKSPMASSEWTPFRSNQVATQLSAPRPIRRSKRPSTFCRTTPCAIIVSRIPAHSDSYWSRSSMISLRPDHSHLYLWRLRLRQNGNGQGHH